MFRRIIDIRGCTADSKVEKIYHNVHLQWIGFLQGEFSLNKMENNFMEDVFRECGETTCWMGHSEWQKKCKIMCTIPQLGKSRRPQGYKRQRSKSRNQTEKTPLILCSSSPKFTHSYHATSHPASNCEVMPQTRHKIVLRNRLFCFLPS